VALLASALFAYGPTRTAVADWLGIGTVRVEQSGAPARPEGDRPVPGGPDDPAGPLELEEAQDRVDFPIVTPSFEGLGLEGVAVDGRVPGGVVVLTYADFTLIEVATEPGAEPWLAKTSGPDAHVTAALVRDRPALWITGTPHEIAYYDREGEQRHDTVRRSGPVLLWERDGVTYRLEGIADFASALAVANSMS
jgi:hypothetical protein